MSARFFIVHDLPIFANDARDAEAIAQRIGVANSPAREATEDELRKLPSGLMLTYYLEKWRPQSAEEARDWASNGREAIRAAVEAGRLRVSEDDDSAIGEQAYHLAHRFHFGAPFLADLIRRNVSATTSSGGLTIENALHNLSLLADATPGQGNEWESAITEPEADGGKKSQSKTKRGRRKAKTDGRGKRLSGDDEDDRKAILRDWNKAHSAGVTAKEFCKRERERADGPSWLNEKALRKIVSWQSTRKRRLVKPR